jgi:CHASE2 domain-containing sensor protein
MAVNVWAHGNVKLKPQRIFLKIKTALKQDRRRGISALTTALLGSLCLLLSNHFLYEKSYDLLFRFKSLLPIPPSVGRGLILYLDESSFKNLSENPLKELNRAWHAQLLNRLFTNNSSPSAVVFDIVFDQRGQGDQDFCQTISNRNVVVAERVEVSKGDQGTIEQPLLPLECIRSAARVGRVEFARSNDDVIRRHPRGTNSLSWVTAELLGARMPDPSKPRWLNYYGPRGTIPWRSYYQILETNFNLTMLSNKVIFVGRGEIVTPEGTQAEAHPSPYEFRIPGVEIQATATLNLLNEDWLTELPRWLELILLTLIGLGFGFLLTWVRPHLSDTPSIEVAWRAAVLRKLLIESLLGIVMVGLFAILLFLGARRWFPWMIAVAVQIPYATAFGVWIAFVPPKPRFDAFISYRRETGPEIADILHDKLADRGLNAFVDVKDSPRNFEDGSRQIIESARGFILIISKDTFERCGEEHDWVRKEVRHALKSRRKIIPFLVEGCEMPKREELPDDMADLVEYNALRYHREPHLLGPQMDKLREEIMT